MRISDWSSDVCSSDLHDAHGRFGGTVAGIAGGGKHADQRTDVDDRAIARLHQLGDCRLDSEEDSSLIDRHHLVPAFNALLLEAARMTDTGSVGKSHNTAKSLDGSGNRIIPARRTGTHPPNEDRISTKRRLEQLRDSNS